MNRNVIETVLGAVVLLTATIFITFAYGSADLGKKGGYTVKAEFERIDGLKPGTDVKMNGVQVGSVISIVLSKETYRATVSFTVDRSIKLPRDTIAMIASESLLGGKYMSLEVGMDEENVATDGSGKLTRTTPPLRLDDLIGHLIFNKDQEKKKDDAGAAPAPAGTPPAATPPHTMLETPKSPEKPVQQKSTQKPVQKPTLQKAAMQQASPPPQPAPEPLLAQEPAQSEPAE